VRSNSRKGAGKGAIAAIIILLIIIGAAAWAVSRHGGQNKTVTTGSATQQQGGTTTSQQAPQTSKIVVIGTTDKITELDPAKAYDFLTWEVLSNVMSGLVTYDPNTGKIVPDLATNWTAMDNDTVWIFHLRKDAKFADGTPCTAYDVVRSINRVMRLGQDPSWLVTDFVKNVTALDKYTVKFVLKTPASYFLALVATPPYYPVSPKYPNDKVAPDATWGGCGPYMIAKWVRDQELVLKPNPYYYGPKPKNSGVIIKFYSNSQALRLALENKEIDVAWRTLNPNDIKSLKNQGYNVIEVPGLFIRYVVIKTDQPPTSNVLVRQALAAAINRPEIAQAVYQGTVEPLYSLVPKGMWSHTDVFKQKYGDGNIQLAKQLLQKAGYSETHKLQITLWYTPTHYGDTEAQLAAVIKQEWESTGMIQVTIKSSEWAQFVNQLKQGQFQTSLLGWYPDYLDPDDYLTPFLMYPANSWTGTGYNNTQVNQLLKKAQMLTDMDQRAQIYKQVQQILAEDVPYIPLVQGKLFVVTNPDVVSLQVSPLMFLIYSSIGVK